MGDNDGAQEKGGGGGGRKEKKKTVPQGFWGPAKQLNVCKQHHSPHVQTFKISARVMGSAWPLSGCTKHRHSLPLKFTEMGGLSCTSFAVSCPNRGRIFKFFFAQLRLFVHLHHVSITSAKFQPVFPCQTKLPYQPTLSRDFAEEKITRSQIIV